MATQPLFAISTTYHCKVWRAYVSIYWAIVKYWILYWHKTELRKHFIFTETHFLFLTSLMKFVDEFARKIQHRFCFFLLHYTTVKKVVDVDLIYFFVIMKFVLCIWICWMCLLAVIDSKKIEKNIIHWSLYIIVINAAH